MGLERKKGIVVDKIDYAEHDMIVTLLTNKRRLAFLANGIRKPQSKNATNLNLYAVVECEVFLATLTNKLSKLKKAVASTNFDYTNKYNLMINEDIAFIMRNSEYISNDFLEKYELFLSKIGDKHTNFWLAWLYANSIMMKPIKPAFNHCYICNSNQNLQYFSWHEGGMVCENHTTKHTSEKDLWLYYYLFTDIYKYLEMCSISDNNRILKEIKNFLFENGYR
ncbi:recombinational DNA repair protein O [Mycoplasmopsis californica]|uniref:DNA repair protein RecO n=1 Tax=Mycoplasmopsis equigenitalium TaxID=114883 RepID=A0ABY5J1E4_9BACT|nr:DNA repair protein RecO [Mycoplasmopsis equigenitalium]UUD37064.1 DNA repair protein RecO [Mycoplasmopsis equigenitalium]VEU69636.1 recombinational DNA repair protein O [Mycoplasmopsis californica]